LSSFFSGYKEDSNRKSSQSLSA